MRCRFSVHTLSMFVLVLATAAVAHAGGANKVNVCHIPPGNPGNWHTITIGENALPAHLAHGDLAGTCEENCDTLCSDGNPCTQDVDPQAAECTCLDTHPPANCDDGNFCTTDACDPASGCVYTPVTCDDGDNCTVDACDPLTGFCVAPPVECPEDQTCDPETGECVGGGPCVGNLCVPGQGVCSPNNDGHTYTCLCLPGFTGMYCEIDPCKFDHCDHGTCNRADDGLSYTCTCDPGWEGILCDTEIDECASNPCVHGDCTDELNGYTCSCLPGWTGTNCDVAGSPTYNCTDRNPCTPENAENGLFYFSADDPIQFIQCSEFGQCYVMNCPPTLVWSQELLTCVSG